MKRSVWIVALLAFVALALVACGAPAAPAGEAGEAAAGEAAPGEGLMTDVGTPRSETLIFQTFDRKAANPDQMNPLMDYAVWRGFRELGWGYLWEMDTGTGESYPELTESMPEVLNDEYTKFRIKLKEGIYWSDGVEFTTDDIIFTFDAYFDGIGKLTNGNITRITNYIKSYEAIDKYTFEVETVKPAYDFTTVMGVDTWASAFIPVPKHIFEQQEDLAAFRNTYPVTLGPYFVKEFDPNGFWQLWERREDWERSAYGWMGEPKPKWVLYKDFGPEESRVLAFVQNQYDVDTFMSPDSIKGAQQRNDKITTFAPKMPYHNMDDACSYGVMMNQHKAPLDKPEVRWALALSLDLKDVGINSVSGEFKASPLPMVDTQILRPVYFDPLIPWLNELALPDGYKPFDPNFGSDLVDRLKEMGVAESELPSTPEEISTGFGIGYWKYDPAEAEKLMASVGMNKNADGFYTLPDGTVWELELVIPGDWNKVMQRVGFSLADSWRKAGFQVNARQVDNAEFGNVQNTNALLTSMLTWYNCTFTPNYLNQWYGISPDYILPADSTELITGNAWRWENERAFELIAESKTMPTTDQRFRDIGVEVLKEFVTDMAFINMMNIPTTIPTNEYYWTGYPKQDNYYAEPYSWWSSAKEMVVNVEPTGMK